MKNKIEIIKCLFPSKDGNFTGVKQPQIENMQCITTSVVKIDNKYYEQFEFIPNNLNLCNEENAKREGDYVYFN